MLGITHINNNENTGKIVKATKRGVSDGIIDALSITAGVVSGKKIAETTKNTTLGVAGGVVVGSGVKAGLTTARECYEIDKARKEVERLESEGGNEKKGFLKK